MDSHSTVMVTGGAGFIGSNIAERLSLRGYRVRIIDDLSSGYAENTADIDVEVHLGTVADAAIMPLFDGVPTVFHLAASVGNRRSNRSAQRLARTLRANLASTGEVAGSDILKR